MIHVLVVSFLLDVLIILSYLHFFHLFYGNACLTLVFCFGFIDVLDVVLYPRIITKCGAFYSIFLFSILILESFVILLIYVEEQACDSLKPFFYWKKIMLCYFSMEMHANIGEQSHYGLLLDSFVLFVMDMFFAFMLMFSFLCLLFLQWICFLVWLIFLIPFIFLMLMLIRINSWIYDIIKF